MGWSCNRKAGCRLDVISAACLANSGMQNKWTDKGDTYFYEVGREQADGSITGTVNKYLPDGIHVCKSGSFKIAPDGSWERGPAWMKKVPFIYIKMHDAHGCSWFDVYRGDETDAGLMHFMQSWLKQWLPGGINEIISGHIPYPIDAIVTNPDTKKEVVKWKQPMFFVWETNEEAITI